MNSKTLRNSVITGAMAGLLFVGAAIASYLVSTDTTSPDLVEAISTSWVTPLPNPAYPNQTYDARLQIANVDAANNGTQNVGVTVSTTNLEEVNVWIEGYGWGYTFDSLITFPMAKNTTKDVIARVKVPSDQDPAVDPVVTMVVTRE